MSRSIKKTPIVKDNGQSKKKAKRLANKKIRKMEDVGNYKKYIRYYESWCIADYVCRWSKEQAIKNYNRLVHRSKLKGDDIAKEFLERFPTLESYLLFWEKSMIRK